MADQLQRGQFGNVYQPQGTESFRGAGKILQHGSRAQLCQTLTPQSVFDFATSKIGLDLCKDSGDGHTDNAYSPLTVGALTYGVTLENLVNGYVPYGNGGTQYKAHLVSQGCPGCRRSDL